jgi:hypothetical protein
MKGKDATAKDVFTNDGCQESALTITERLDQCARRHRFGCTAQDRNEEINVIVGQPNWFGGLAHRDSVRGW